MQLKITLTAILFADVEDIAGSIEKWNALSNDEKNAACDGYLERNRDDAEDDFYYENVKD